MCLELLRFFILKYRHCKVECFDSGLVSHLQISPNSLKTGGESDLKGSKGPLTIPLHISSSLTLRLLPQGWSESKCSIFWQRD